MPDPVDPARVSTARLDLTPAGPNDVAALFELHSDPRVWEHLPAGRHIDPARTRGLVDTVVAQWAGEGLGYWCARSRQPLGPVAAGTVLGMGGCAAAPGAPW